MDAKMIFFWVLLVAMVVPSLLFGVAKIISKKDKVELFRRLGYPLWFMKLVGLGEVIVALGLLFNTTRLGAIVLSAIILIGAVVSHIRANEPKKALAPSFVFIHLALIYIFTFYLS